MIKTRFAVLILAFSYNALGSDLKQTTDTYIENTGLTVLSDFREFLSIPNVSMVQEDMLKNARWIVDYIASRGFESEIVTAGRAPYVIAHRIIDPNAATVLIYAHFDGQPVNPPNWTSPPFEPTLRDGDTPIDWQSLAKKDLNREWRVYARSAGDDKAPVIALMHAIDMLTQNDIPISVNVKLFLDGEEEVGSPTLSGILQQHVSKLDADLMLFCDGPMHQSRLRQIVFGVRGDTGVNLTAYGANRPLHSGHYGNWAPHPTDSLIRLLTSLKDESGKILVEGYHDEMRPVSEAERKAVAAMPTVDQQLKHELALGRTEGDGERLESLIMQPAIVIKGFQAGGVGSRARNIILPTASAALDLRLVPGQTVRGVQQALLKHFQSQGFHVVETEPTEEVRRQHEKVLKVEWGGGYRAFRTNLSSEPAQRLVSLVTRLDGREPLLTPTMGGSLPIYLFEDELKLPIVILPIANHDNNQHGRDENMRLANLFDAIAVYAAVLRDYDRPN